MCKKEGGEVGGGKGAMTCSCTRRESDLQGGWWWVGGGWEFGSSDVQLHET